MAPSPVPEAGGAGGARQEGPCTSSSTSSSSIGMLQTDRPDWSRTMPKLSIQHATDGNGSTISEKYRCLPKSITKPPSSTDGTRMCECTVHLAPLSSRSEIASRFFQRRLRMTVALRQHTWHAASARLGDQKERVDVRLNSFCGSLLVNIDWVCGRSCTCAGF